jgi:hypothetical protein
MPSKGPRKKYFDIFPHTILLSHFRHDGSLAIDPCRMLIANRFA